MGNIVNRVFDSSGPEGKVRGTPQQIIEKYTQLARDATLSNDRIAAENFQQHAEHYTRMLAEAQREQEARREQQEQQQRERARERQEAENGRAAAAPETASQDQPTDAVPEGDAVADAPQNAPIEPAEQPAMPEVVADAASEPQPDVIDLASDGEGDTGLVETPESKPKPKRAPRARKPRTPKAKPVEEKVADVPAAEASEASAPPVTDAPEAAE